MDIMLEAVTMKKKVYKVSKNVLRNLKIEK